MPKTKISEFSATPANNTDIDSINIAEGCAPSGINDAIRELMAQLKDFQTGAVGDSFNGPVGATTAGTGAFTTLSASSTATLSGLTASTALALDASKNVVSVTNTGTGSNVLATSPTLVTPILGTPTSATLTNATGLPISTGVSGLGTGIATALAVNTGSAGAPVLFNGALGTPSSGTVTNLTGTASININGTVGATTASTGAFTTLTTSSTVTHNGGTANGVAFLNGSKVLTSGTALVFNGTNLGVGATSPTNRIDLGFTDTTIGWYLSASYSAGITFNSSARSMTLATQSGDDSDFIAFKTGVSSAERVRIERLGNVGIGTSSPQVKLEVNGQIFSSATGGNNLIINSVGANYGFISNRSTGVWSLGYGATIATLGTSALTWDSTGNVGIGTSSPAIKLVVNAASANVGIADFADSATIGLYLETVSGVPVIGSRGGAQDFRVKAGQNLQLYTTNTERARINTSGNLLCGTTTDQGSRIVSDGGSGTCLWAKTTGSASAVIVNYNAATTGDNSFHTFYTETSATLRGSISYNRAGGLTVYNTTSDYRAKDISGPVTNSGALIDSVPVYMGKMKWATEERPMFIAHEVPSYAHTGEKDAVDADGNPVYQQMDASALIPVMWAEIQSLRQRLSAANL